MLQFPRCNVISRFKNSQSGASAVEFALVAPVFVLLLFGMIAYGIYFGAAHSVQQLTADAARTAVAGLDDGERRQIVADFVAANTANYSFLDPARVAYQTQQAGTEFRVSIRYNASDLPIWNLLPGIVLPGTTIDRRTTIRIGGI